MSSPEDGTAEPTPDGGDPGNQLSEAEQYDKRVREDPDFALDQVSKFRSENSRLANVANSFKQLGPIIDQLGGESKVMQDLTELHTYRNNPSMARVMERFNTTGQIQTESGYGDGIDYEEEDPNVSALKGQLQKLEGKLDTMSGKVGKANVQNMMTQIQNNPIFADDFKEIVAPAIMDQVTEWEKNQSGRDLLGNLTVENLQQIAYLALGDKIKTIGKRLYERELQQRKDGSTDGPPTTTTSGGDPPREGQMSVREAMEDFAQREGINF